MDDASQVEVLDAAEHLVEKVGHPLMVQVHVDHLVMYTFCNGRVWPFMKYIAADCEKSRDIVQTWQRFASISSITM